MFASKTINGVALGGKTCGLSLPNRPKSITVTCRATRLEMQKKSNLYKVLALDSESVGPYEIKKAYRNMARHYHPDVCHPSRKEESTRIFVELHRAYETLSNPDLRRRYDIEMQMNESESTMTFEFSREIWEAQLNELRRHSDRREKVGPQRS